jgi:hypothetical protein
MTQGGYCARTAANLPEWRVLVDELMLPLEIRSEHPSFGARSAG